MNPDRFEGLAEAYGGDLDRWPPAERQAALRQAADQPALTGAALGKAARLDEILAAAPSQPPSRELRARIVQAAPGPRSPLLAWRWLAGIGLTTGMLGAAAAGVAAGVVVAPMALSRTHVAAPDPAEEAAALLREPTDLGEG